MHGLGRFAKSAPIRTGATQELLIARGRRSMVALQASRAAAPVIVEAVQMHSAEWHGLQIQIMSRWGRRRRKDAHQVFPGVK